MPRKLTTEEFIKKAKEIHGDKYDYSKVNYTNNSTKVCIICPEHGEFWQTPKDHLKGKCCLKCGFDKIKNKKRYNKETFIEKAKIVHGNKYNYSKVEYINSETKVCIICPEHGEFWQTPGKHLSGRGCRKCQYVQIGNIKRKSCNDFIEKAQKTHNYRYDYSNVEYVNYHTPVNIRCYKHGIFEQTPAKHLVGHGCPRCSSSHLERLTIELLEQFNIKYEKEKTFDWLKNKSNLRLDFYLPDYNVAIECQGEQHFRPIKFYTTNEEKATQNFEFQKKRDTKKQQLCYEHNIMIVYINYNDDINTIINKLKNKIYCK